MIGINSTNLSIITEERRIYVEVFRESHEIIVIDWNKFSIDFLNIIHLDHHEINDFITDMINGNGLSQEKASIACDKYCENESIVTQINLF